MKKLKMKETMLTIRNQKKRRFTSFQEMLAVTFFV